MTDSPESILKDDEDPADVWLWEFVPGGCGAHLKRAGRRQCGQRGTSSAMVAYLYCESCRGPALIDVTMERDQLRAKLARPAAVPDRPNALEAAVIAAAIQWNEDGEPEALESAATALSSSLLRE